MGLFNLFRKNDSNATQVYNVRAHKIYRYTAQLDEIVERWNKLKWVVDEMPKEKSHARKVGLEIERRKLEAAIQARLQYIASKL